ncbi:MAG: class I SAM-dependent methyltransferase [Polyangiaceae bacterium]|jgi:2-polyprenyl-3-methyl-5-hydroxy-6-metoxy-1,4-benzoquinol methylase|nr:class I SAM-dependent methyltransferase [Polyangiaceae bacterium]
MLTDAYFDRFETPKYRSQNPLQRHLIRRFARAIHAMFVAAGPAKRVVEIGVGEGFLSGYLSEQLPDIEFTGVDADEPSLAGLRAKFPRVRAHHGFIEDLSMLSPPYDVVMCCEVLEHVQDPRRALESLASLGAKRLVLSVPHEPFFMLSNLARGKNVARLGNDPEHLHHWSKRAFKSFLEERLDVLQLETSYPWILALAAPKGS